MRGEIKKLKEGFGFIRGSDGTDYFFHKQGLDCATRTEQDALFPRLRETQQVDFLPTEGAKGPRAEQVRPLAS